MHYKLYPEIIRNCQIENGNGYPPHFSDETAYDPSGDFGRQKEHIVHLFIYSPWCFLMAAPRFAARLPHLWVCPWAQCSSRTWGTAWKRNVQAWVDGALEWKKMCLDRLRPPRYLEKWGNLIHSWFSDFWILFERIFYVRLEGLSGRFHEDFSKSCCYIGALSILHYIYIFIPINVYTVIVCGCTQKEKTHGTPPLSTNVGPPKSPSYVCWIVFTGPTADISIINAGCSSYRRNKSTSLLQTNIWSEVFLKT